MTRARFRVPGFRRRQGSGETRHRSRCERRRSWSPIACAVGLTFSVVLGARQADLPLQLTQILESERAFAARSLDVGWKQAFLDYFAYDAIGFEDGKVGLAREQFRTAPDPPKDAQLIWEPRYGDVAGSGELGYLTGPAKSIDPTRNNGQPRHSAYFSLWQRQRDGTYLVIMDVGTPTPREVPFAPGFTRASNANRFTGDYDERTPPLGTADTVLNSALRLGQVRAYRGRLAPGARLHRNGSMPLVGERAILAALANAPTYSAADSRFATAAQSGDLGYTWGTYIIPPRGRVKREEGFYVRVWVRDRDGQWKVAADITQPQ